MMKANQSYQKCYVNKQQKPLRFKVGGQVFLRMSPTSDAMWFKQKGKLIPGYIGPYLQSRRSGILITNLEESTTYFMYPNYVKRFLPSPCDWARTSLIQEDLAYKEQPIEILYHKEKLRKFFRW